MAGNHRVSMAAALAAALLLLLPLSAAAHILSLARSDPADSGTLCRSARRITATFDGELDGKTSLFTVQGADGSAVAEGRIDLDDVERSRLLAELPDALPAGNYTVNWTAVSNDDKQETSGSFRFTAADCLEIPWRELAMGSVGLAMLGAVAVVAMNWRQPAEEDSSAFDAADPDDHQSAHR